MNKISPEDLRKMPKEEVHEGYKKIIALMLHDFYVQASNQEHEIQTVQDLQNFIDLFIKERIKPPQENWEPGDQGK